MKKILTALLLSAAILATGCSNNSQSDTGSSPVTTEEPQSSGLSAMTSQEIVSSMKIGWNLGNTLDACQADRDGDGRIDEHVDDGEEPDETLWGNPLTPRSSFRHSGTAA